MTYREIDRCECISALEYEAMIQQRRHTWFRTWSPKAATAAERKMTMCLRRIESLTKEKEQ